MIISVTDVEALPADDDGDIDIDDIDEDFDGLDDPDEEAPVDDPQAVSEDSPSSVTAAAAARRVLRVIRGPSGAAADG